MSNLVTKPKPMFSALSLLLCASVAGSVAVPQQAFSAPGDASAGSNKQIAENNPYVQDYNSKSKGKSVPGAAPATEGAAKSSRSSATETTASAGSVTGTKGSRTASAKGGEAAIAGEKAGTETKGKAGAKPGDKTGTASSTTGKKKEKLIWIVKTTKHSSTNGTKWQQFADSIVLKPGQENLPLTMTINNGGEGLTSMRAIRGYLSGRLLFSDKSFKGKSTLTLDMTNTLTPGETQIIFESFGAKGATFSWNLSAKQTPTITSLSPKSSAPGKVVKGLGKLLPSDMKAYTCTVGGKTATIISASPEAVEFRVPTGLKMDSDGTVTVQFTVFGVKQKALTLKIAEEPEITQFSHVSISSQQQLTISGKHFGNDAKDVKVTFNGAQGQVVSCSDSSIAVVTPEIENIPTIVDVSVEVNGLKCKREGKIQFSMRNIENYDIGSPQSPFEVPLHLE